MTLTADQPGLQFYSGNFLDGIEQGQGGGATAIRRALSRDPEVPELDQRPGLARRGHPAPRQDLSSHDDPPIHRRVAGDHAAGGRQEREASVGHRRHRRHRRRLRRGGGRLQPLPRRQRRRQLAGQGAGLRRPVVVAGGGGRRARAAGRSRGRRGLHRVAAPVSRGAGAGLHRRRQGGAVRKTDHARRGGGGAGDRGGAREAGLPDGSLYVPVPPAAARAGVAAGRWRDR